jgi:hypothetical protein
LKKAEYDAEVNTAKAEADLAYDLKVLSIFTFIIRVSNDSFVKAAE